MRTPERVHAPGLMRAHPSTAAADGRDLDACRSLLANGSRSFHVASHLLPSRVRDRATALYAFCRIADDAVDEGGAVDAVPRLRERLDRCYAGNPFPIAADRSFARIVECCAIPRAIPDALIEGFAWDRDGRTYETLADLHAYAARVAGTVGAMMSLAMDARDARALARACDLGVAMQLTNIARDVGEDARAGRLYLPLAWLRGNGIDPAAFLREPAFTPSLGAVIGRVLDEAERLYTRAAGGIGELPAGCRPAIESARTIYREIGRTLAHDGCDSVSRRARVGGARKLVLALASVPALMRAPCADIDPLPACEFLVRAAATSGPPDRAPGSRPVRWWQLHAQMLATVELFARLDERDRLRQARTDRAG